MNLPFELHVALRYLLARRKQAFISVISLISTLGVIVGVMALVIALALMTGLQGELRDRILGSTAHVYVWKRRRHPRLPGRGRRGCAACPHVVGAAPGHPRQGADHERPGRGVHHHQGDRPGARDERDRHRPVDEERAAWRRSTPAATGRPGILLGARPREEAGRARRRRGPGPDAGGHARRRWGWCRGRGGSTVVGIFSLGLLRVRLGLRVRVAAASARAADGPRPRRADRAARRRHLPRAGRWRAAIARPLGGRVPHAGLGAA